MCLLFLSSLLRLRSRFFFDFLSLPLERDLDRERLLGLLADLDLERRLPFERDLLLDRLRDFFLILLRDLDFLLDLERDLLLVFVLERDLDRRFLDEDLRLDLERE